MIFGQRNTEAPDVAYFIVLLGQSQADGRREPTRLQNTDFNYQGISTGYPTVRSGQPQYVAAPSSIYIYHKAGASSDDFSPDDGAWEEYEAGVNSSHDDNSFGSELSCATQIQQATGRPVYIIKVAFGGTSLNMNAPSAAQFPPGNWNPTIRYMAYEYWLKRAMRDFRAANHTLRAVPLCVNWWQGENDGINAVGTSLYQSQLVEFMAYWDRAMESVFVMYQRPIWNLTKLDFNRNANEAAITTAINNVAASRSDTYVINTDPYPLGQDLTTQEAAPLAVGLSNADGGLDNLHKSYIGQLAAGELQFANIQTAGLI